jgi:hypothetical protein
VGDQAQLGWAHPLHELNYEAQLKVGSRAGSAQLVSHTLVNIIALYIKLIPFK